jgi:hypothetical protein
MSPKLAKTLIVLTSLLVALVMCEAGVRLLGLEYPDFYEDDPVVGHKLRPNVKGYYLNEGGGYVSINADGWRDREHSCHHPPNTLRIAVLGDSYTEAMQVHQAEAYWAVMASSLQRCSGLNGRNVQVINFGVSGYGTSQELLTLQHRVWKYSPDLVLLAFTPGNDVSDNSRNLKRVDHHPYHVYQGDKLILDDRLTKETWLARKNTLRQKIYLDALFNFRVFQVARHAQELFRQYWLRRHLELRADASVPGHVWGINDLIYQKPATADWQEAWRVTEGVLLRLRDEVVQHGARFFVVTVTEGIQVDPDVSKRAAFAKSLGVSDLLYTEHRLGSFCQSHDIPILLLGPPFQEYATQHQVYLHGFGKTLGFGHWNQAGHLLAGKMLAPWLCGHLH